ncbi:MAG: pyruvate kinase [Saonia sp.]
MDIQKVAVKEGKIKGLIAKIEAIIKVIHVKEQEAEELLNDIHPIYRESARNLIHYTTLRQFDLRSIQKKLQNLGFTRLANAEGHIMFSLIRIRYNLYRLLDHQPIKQITSGLSIKNKKKLLANHTKELFGRRKGRRVRIMVTQPTEAAYDYQIVLNMVQNGMDCARINCAHDGPEVWEKIILHVKQASKELKKDVTIAMDLAGPKIRTGTITPGPKVRKFKPERDEMGNVVSPALLVLVPEIKKDSASNTLPLPPEWLQKLTLGDKLTVRDTRNKRRKLNVVHISDDEVHVHCYKTVYISTGTLVQNENGKMESVAVRELPPIERFLLLRTNDMLTVTKANIMGNPAVFNEDGNLVKGAHISCQVPTVFDHIQEGDPILFDDGKIEGRIEWIRSDDFEVRITRAAVKGSKLKAEKGINFPMTLLGISGLTDKDKTDLEFVTKYADIVNFSFVKSKNDVEELLTELEKWDAVNRLSIILKIETRFAFDNLEEILLAAMKVKYIGVMIARGDLAVETGWDTIGKAQEGILSLCGAAHIPVVWATQVLENLAKNGLPSRSEITDTISSLQSECVMLNKGPYIIDVLQLLNKILSRMEQFHEKKELMLPKMEKL